MRASICLLTICVGATLFSWTAAVASDHTEVQIKKLDNHLSITIDGKPFTDYWFGARKDRPYVRPFFWPVLAAGDVPVTSDQYTLVNIRKVPKADHPHHQSLWVSQGDVNGVDHWSLGKGKGEHSAKQVHLKFDDIASDHFVEELAWEGKDGKPMLDEKRTVAFGAYPDGSRFIDITSAFTPVNGNVVFGDTKEAGLMAVRMATQIAKHPTITQSTGKGGEGEAGEKATWGKRADWCDESGIIDGKPFGVAIFDAPSNPRHPAPWHVRAYGLMCPNIFALSEFNRKLPKHAGDFTIKAGQTVTFRHRAVIHTGNAEQANLPEKYKQFAAE